MENVKKYKQSELVDFNVNLLTNNLPENKVLFYPCSGNDMIDAISYFYPIVDTFFFCDINCHNVSQKQIKAILPNFDLIKSYEEYIWRKNTDEISNSRQVVDVRGRIVEPPLYRKTETTRLTQIWKNEKENREINIIKVVGDGYKVFTNEELLKQIGIFFYRGDGKGEGGSDVRWLETEKDNSYSDYKLAKHFDVVLQKIANYGLIVTDGSNCGEEYEFFKQYYNSRDLSFSMIGDAIVNGNTFRCLGKITQRYGPTLVWQINKNNN